MCAFVLVYLLRCFTSIALYLTVCVFQMLLSVPLLGNVNPDYARLVRLVLAYALTFCASSVAAIDLKALYHRLLPSTGHSTVPPTMRREGEQSSNATTLPSWAEPSPNEVRSRLLTSTLTAESDGPKPITATGDFETLSNSFPSPSHATRRSSTASSYPKQGNASTYDHRAVQPNALGSGQDNMRTITSIAWPEGGAHPIIQRIPRLSITSVATIATSTSSGSSGSTTSASGDSEKSRQDVVKDRQSSVYRQTPTASIYPGPPQDTNPEYSQVDTVPPSSPSDVHQQSRGSTVSLPNYTTSQLKYAAVTGAIRPIEPKHSGLLKHQEHSFSTVAGTAQQNKTADTNDNSSSDNKRNMPDSISAGSFPSTSSTPGESQVKKQVSSTRVEYPDTLDAATIAAALGNKHQFHTPSSVTAASESKSVAVPRPQVFSARQAGYIARLERKFRRLIELADYSFKREEWTVQGTYEGMEVQAHNSDGTTATGNSGVMCRGRRVVRVPPKHMMSLLWLTQHKPNYDEMCEAVISLEKINHHVMVEEHIYKGFGMVAARRMVLCSGWQKIEFKGRRGDAYYPLETSDGMAFPKSNPHSWNYNEEMTLHGMYDRSSWEANISTSSSSSSRSSSSSTTTSLPPIGPSKHGVRGPRNVDGYEYGGDGFALLAISLPDSEYDRPTNAPPANPTCVEAYLDLGGFFIRSVKIPKCKEARGSWWRSTSTSSTTTSSSSVGGKHDPKEGEWEWGCEVVGLGSVDLAGQLPRWIANQVSRRQPLLVGRGEEYLLRQKDKNIPPFVKTIDVSYLDD